MADLKITDADAGIRDGELGVFREGSDLSVSMEKRWGKIVMYLPCMCIILKLKHWSVLKVDRQPQVFPKRLFYIVN